MTATAEARPRVLASRHWCALRSEAGSGFSGFHTARNGKPRSERCTYCHGPLTVQTGLWGVFRHRGDGRYRLESALTTHVSETAAERARDKAYELARAKHGYGADECNVVVRWIPLDAT